MSHRLLPFLGLFLLVPLLTGLPSRVQALEGCTDDCGDPSGDCGVFVTDALIVLQEAVDIETDCELCVCDVDSSGSVKVTDALLVLKAAIGIEDITLTCTGCTATTTTTSTSSTLEDSTATTTNTTLPTTTTSSTSTSSTTTSTSTSTTSTTTLGKRDGGAATRTQ